MRPIVQYRFLLLVVVLPAGFATVIETVDWEKRGW
jgi:hypothetical protein